MFRTWENINVIFIDDTRAISKMFTKCSFLVKIIICHFVHESIDWKVSIKALIVGI